MAVGAVAVMVGRAKVDTTDFLRGAMFEFLDLTGFVGLEDVVTFVVGVVKSVCLEGVAMPFRGVVRAGPPGGTTGKGAG